MPPIVSGPLTTFQTTNDKIDDLQNALDWLPATQMDTALLRRWGINGKNGNSAKSTKIEWSQTSLRPRSETITLADGTGVTVTVTDANNYQIGELIRCENEVMRVTARPSATTLTVTRAYSGTTGAAHAAKQMYSLGTADVENAVPGASVTETPTKLFNYTQTFSVPVEVSKDQIMSWTVDGNTLDAQLERRFIEQNRQLARAVLYGRKYQDVTNKINVMGGFFEQIVTNVTNVGGANTIASIDALLLKIVNKGGDPKTIAVSPFQKQKLDALDANKQLLGKQEHTGGNLITNTWQSGILDHPLDIVVDKSLMDDQLLITDDDMLEIMPFSNNGESGSWATYDATTPGQDGKKKVLRGKFTNKLHNEAAHGYLYGLT